MVVKLVQAEGMISTRGTIYKKIAKQKAYVQLAYKQLNADGEYKKVKVEPPPHTITKDFKNGDGSANAVYSEKFQACQKEAEAHKPCSKDDKPEKMTYATWDQKDPQNTFTYEFDEYRMSGFPDGDGTGMLFFSLRDDKAFTLETARQVKLGAVRRCPKHRLLTYLLKESMNFPHCA